MSGPDDELTEISGWTGDDVSVLYAACVLEQLSLIELVEQLNELNQNKLLSIGAGEASNLLHEFWDQGYKRMPAKRRATLYASVFGATDEGATDEGATDESAPQDGPADGSNDAFAELFEALVSALADNSPQAVAPAAAALRDNLADHTGEQTAQAAAELRGTLGEIAAVLSDMELLSAYRVDDIWQLVERVQEQFGGTTDVPRVRTRAVSGARILRRLPELCDDRAEPGEELLAAARRWLPAKLPPA